MNAHCDKLAKAVGRPLTVESVVNLVRPMTIASINITHTRLTALFRDYPGEPVPER